MKASKCGICGRLLWKNRTLCSECETKINDFIEFLQIGLTKHSEFWMREHIEGMIISLRESKSRIRVREDALIAD